MARRKPKQLSVEELVRKRVDEVLAVGNVAAFLEPDFQSRAIQRGIGERQTVWDRRRHNLYFEKWGCRICGRKDVPHCANGHCQLCFVRVYQRYERLRKQWLKEHPVERIGVDPASKAARRLLQGMPEEGTL